MTRFEHTVLRFGIFMSIIFCRVHNSMAGPQFSIGAAEQAIAEESKLRKLQEYFSNSRNYKIELTPAQQKLSTDLLQLVDHRLLPVGSNIEHVVQNMQLSNQLYLNTTESKMNTMINEGIVYVYIHFNQDSDESILEPFDVNITDSDEKNKVVAVWVKVKELETIATSDGVRTIRTVLPPVTRTGSVLTEGDVVHRSSDVRSIFSNSSGSGIKIGIISNGVDNRADAQASGDLPLDWAGLTVIRNDEGGDEGTAMLEIVHDMVPDAELYFHDWTSNSIAFKSAIDTLVSAGCDIICDDIGWPGEPFFEDGAVASHVRSVIENNDIIYVTATGNDGNKHYQGNFHSLSSDLPNYHDFSHGTSDFTDLYVNIPAGSKVIIVLQWNDQFGSSANNYDLHLYSRSAKNVVQRSNNVQDGNDDPLEFIVYTADSSTAGIFEIWVTKYGNANPRILEVIVSLDGDSFFYTNNRVPDDSIYGHPALPSVVAVGAIGVNDPNDPEHSNIESFSSRGPVTITYPAEDIRLKPDICGVDRVSVTGAGGFPSTFPGTSAAAPHVAAIMAQLWAALPHCTGNEIRDMVLADAVDLGEVGIDNIFGFGRADALNAFYSNYYSIDSFPYSEDFERDGNLPSGWRNSIFDDTNWSLHTGATFSSNTGPSSAFSGDYYLYIESSGDTGHPYKTAILESPYFDLTPQYNPIWESFDDSFTLSFWYHMYGAEMGTLSLEATEDEGNSWYLVDSLSGNQGDDWKYKWQFFEADSGKKIKIRFKGVTGTGDTSDMAIDYVEMRSASTDIEEDLTTVID